MKNFAVVIVLGALVSSTSFAALKEVNCWKGFNQKEQNANKSRCLQQRGEAQKCSDNIWEHGHAAYDVCLLEAVDPLTIVTTWKGFNQREQDKNLKECRKQESKGSVCVTNIWRHKQAAYDVCLMQ